MKIESDFSRVLDSRVYDICSNTNRKPTKVARIAKFLNTKGI